MASYFARAPSPANNFATTGGRSGPFSFCLAFRLCLVRHTDRRRGRARAWLRSRRRGRPGRSRIVAARGSPSRGGGCTMPIAVVVPWCCPAVAEVMQLCDAACEQFAQQRSNAAGKVCRAAGSQRCKTLANGSLSKTPERCVFAPVITPVAVHAPTATTNRKRRFICVTPRLRQHQRSGTVQALVRPYARRRASATARTTTGSRRATARPASPSTRMRARWATATRTTGTLK